MNLWIKIKNFFKPAPTVQVEFEEIIKIEEVAVNIINPPVEEVKTDSDQITDSVTVVKKPRKKKVT